MCWETVAMEAVSVGSQLISGSGAASRQDELYQQNAQIANADAVEKYAQNQLQQIQEEAKAVNDRFNTGVSTRQARATALASTQNEGASTDAVLRDVERQGANQENITSVNLKNAQNVAQANNTSIKMEAQNRIDSVAKAESPDILAAAISGLGTSLPYALDTPYKGKDHGGKMLNGKKG